MVEVAMKRLKFILLALPVVMLMASGAWGQIQPPPPPDTVLTCDDLPYFPTERVSIPVFRARPGDTAFLPVRITNTTAASGFTVDIQYDSLLVRPVYIPDTTIDTNGTVIDTLINDSTFIDRLILGDASLIPDSIQNDISGGAQINPDFPLTGRFPISRWTRTGNAPFYTYTPRYDLQTIAFRDYNTRFVDSVQVIKALFSSFEDVELPAGNDVTFYFKFLIQPTMGHLDTAYFEFHEQNRFFIDSSDFPTEFVWLDGCDRTTYTLFFPTGDTIFDTTFGPDDEIVAIDTIPEQTTDVKYPQPTRGALIVDTTFVPGSNPTVNSFTASPSTVGPGQSVTLSWTTTNATSVSITRNGTSLGDFSPNGNTTDLPPQQNGTYTYTLTASGNDMTATSSQTVTFDSGGGGGGDGPTITFNPAGGVYTTEQGEPVSFTVTATDPDGQTVTLTASNLPNNATFSPNPATGLPSATGTFSFVPDFNQSGVFQITFTAVDGDNEQTTVSASVSVTELQFDRLFSSSSEDLAPVGGLPGASGIYFPINLVTQLTVYGVQFDMTYPSSQVKIDSFIPTGRIPDWVIYDNVGDTPGQVRVVTFGLANEPVVSDTTSAILWAVMTVDSNNTPWTSLDIGLANGRESVNPDPNIGSLELLTEPGIIEIDSIGDVNLDKFIDVADAVSTVGNIIGDFTFTTRQYATANIVIDESINVFDLVGVINTIYGLPVDAGTQPVSGGEPATIAIEHDPLQAGSSGMMRITSELPERVAGVQLEIDYNAAALTLGVPTLTEDNDKFSLRYKDHGQSMTVLLYHMAPFKQEELLQAGAADLVNIPIIARQNIEPGDKSKLRMSQALLATPTAASVAVDGIDPELPFDFSLAQNYPNPFNPTTTISFTIGSGASGGVGPRTVNLEIFNVLGQKVSTLVNDKLTPGSYDVVWDATTDNGRRVATGIYLYRLQVDDESTAKKMLFLK
ncbi:T9SS type A sorting domain-containing protein [candidate division GN15 bacterium]|nr:T9SS type A sorting domain-containing protein [candidate division GN15 bacterium]